MSRMRSSAGAVTGAVESQYLVGSALAFGPLDHQPFLGTRRRAQVIPMRRADTSKREARLHGAARSFSPSQKLPRRLGSVGGRPRARTRDADVASGADVLRWGSWRLHCARRKRSGSRRPNRRLLHDAHGVGESSRHDSIAKLRGRPVTRIRDDWCPRKIVCHQTVDLLQGRSATSSGTGPRRGYPPPCAACDLRLHFSGRYSRQAHGTLIGVRPSNPDRADEPSAKHRARKIPTNTLAVFRGILRARGAGDRLIRDGSDYSDGLRRQGLATKSVRSGTASACARRSSIVTWRSRASQPNGPRVTQCLAQSSFSTCVKAASPECRIEVIELGEIEIGDE